MLLLNSNFLMIYTIHKMLVLLKITRIVLKEYNRLSLFKKNYLFSQHVMMESLILEDKNIVKDIRNPFALKKEINYTAIKDVRNLSRPEKENKTIKDKTLTDIKNLFEHKYQENVYKPV